MSNSDRLVQTANLPRLRNTAKEIQIKIVPDSSEHLYSAESSDPLAYQAYLHGRLELEQKNVPAFHRALEQFTNAVALDPHYARAYG